MDNSEQQELEAKLEDLKKRWPAHSVPAAMWRELEELEEALEKLKKGNKAKG
ncbi:MAG: histidine kinase [Dehalococcoidia bacterium]